MKEHTLAIMMLVELSKTTTKDNLGDNAMTNMKLQNECIGIFESVFSLVLQCPQWPAALAKILLPVIERCIGVLFVILL